MSTVAFMLLAISLPFKSVEGVKISCLENIRGKTGRARVEVVVAAGALHEDEGGRGVAHLLEHLILRPLGFDDSNGATGWDYTSFHRSVHGEELAQAAAELVSAVADPDVSENALRLERQVVLRELDVRGADRLESVRDPLFEKTKLARSPGGSSDDVRGLTAAQIRGFFQKHYRKENMAIILQGATDCGATTDHLRAALKKIPAGAGPSVPRVPNRAEARRGLPGTGFFSGFYWFDETPQAEVVYRLVAKYLEQAALSQLRKERGLAYSPEAGFDRRGRGGRIWLQVRTDNAADEVRHWYEEQLRALRQSPDPHQMLAGAKRPAADALEIDLPRRALAALRGERSPQVLLAELDQTTLLEQLPRLLADTRRFDTSATGGNTWSIIILVLVGIGVLGAMFYVARTLV